MPTTTASRYEKKEIFLPFQFSFHEVEFIPLKEIDK